MKNLNLIALLIFFCICQVRGQNINLSGQVFDNRNNPIVFANVILQSELDSVFIAGTVTDSLGQFTFQQKERNCLLKISCLGYKTRIINAISENLGIIVLLPDEQMLAELTVTGNLPTFKMESGGVSTDIQNSYLSKLGTAQEVLAQLPFVNKSKDKITVFGKGEPLIYINNRLVRDNAELEQLNSNQIKKVTVISNPGAEYDATIQAVIRIETIRLQGDGLSGNTMARITIDKRFSHNEAVNLNYRHGNLDIFGMLRYGKIGDLILLNLEQKMQSNATETLVSQIGNQEQKSQSLRANIGVNYIFNKNHSAGIKFQTTKPLQNISTVNSEFSASKNNVSVEHFQSVLTADQTKNKPFSNYLNAYYEGTFIEWMSAKLNIDYADGKGGSSNTVENFQQNSTETVQTQDKNNYDLYAAKLILTSPLWSGQLNYGYEISQTNNNQYFNVLQKGNSDVLNSSQNTAKQLLNAAFFTYSREFGKFVADMSVRYENVDFLYFKNGQKEEESSKIYHYFFPSASLAYQNDNMQMQLSYRNSTYRPSYYDLRTEVQYDNPYSYEAGNPYLKPTIMNTLQYMFVWKDLQTQIAYNIYRNKIVFYPVLLSESVICYQKNNLENSQNFTFSAAYAPTIKWWKPSLEFSVMKDFLQYGEPPLNFDKQLAIIALNNNFQFPKGLNVTVNFSYQSKGHADMMYAYDWFSADILLSKSFINNKLRVNIGANDIFGTANQKILLVGNNIGSSIWKNQNTRNIYLSITYNFNSTRSKYAGEQATDELRRL